jgi:hypothetical protein
LIINPNDLKTNRDACVFASIFDDSERFNRGINRDACVFAVIIADFSRFNRENNRSAYSFAVISARKNLLPTVCTPRSPHVKILL